MPKKLLLENTTCPRCAGTGRYSFNMMHGSVCYGCSGAGVKLTKRGRVAQEYLNTLKRKPAREFKVGEKYFLEGFSCGSIGEPNRWVTIQSIETNESGGLEWRGWDERRNHGPIHYTVNPDTSVRFCRTAEQIKEHNAKALAFQSMLTKMGKPMKGVQ